jgi:hypothetical protein
MAKKDSHLNNKDLMQINNTLLNVITPFGGLEFHKNKIHLGENLVKIYGILKYPSGMARGWMSKISNLPNVVTTQIFEPTDNSGLLTDLSNSVARNNGVVESARDALVRQRAEKASIDAQKLMIQIDQYGEIIGYMSYVAMVIGRDEIALEKNCRIFEGTVASLNCRAKVMTFQQEEAFKTVSPYNTPHREILDITRRNVPMSSFIQGFPFASNAFTDSLGFPFGKNSKGGLVVLDHWVRGGDRTNSNFVVTGVPGVGKSTTIKHLALNDFALGTVIILIDPEREYKELCENLEGKWLNAGGGSFIVNPLQFKVVPLDDENEDEGKLKLYDESLKLHNIRSQNEINTTISMDMALHFKSLEVFFKLYAPEITTKQMALLKQLLEGLYNSFNIYWNTDAKKLKNTDYPTFSDFYKYAVKYHESDKISESLKDDVFEIIIILRELAEGADNFIWNGHSTVDLNSNFICLDTLDLQGTSENVKKAQYYNLLTWAWERMSRDREERVFLWADEAYLMVDPQVPQSLIYLRNVAKRARKYSAGLGVIFHSVVDVLDPSVKMYGQALLDVPTYKIIMGTDGPNLHETSKIYGLSSFEEEKLAAKQRGTSLFFVGSRRFIIQHEISEYELSLMGKAGGK